MTRHVGHDDGLPTVVLPGGWSWARPWERYGDSWETAAHAVHGRAVATMAFHVEPGRFAVERPTVWVRDFAGDDAMGYAEAVDLSGRLLLACEALRKADRWLAAQATALGWEVKG
ncbi:MAG: hypothetical protein LBS56_10315 [Propionibacteriaceae bacterium]|jgi:hypothetical protein|nr:hypothetical protein [Propionibacteriaceae bacterium]